MKKITHLLVFLQLILFSCSSDDNSNSNVNETPKPEFAMTATINGKSFKANNPFGTNLYSSTNIWDYYPEIDYIMLQGRQGGVFGTPEINIWLKKSDIVVGSYTIGTETFTTPSSHFIDLTDLVGDEFEYTKNGTITITSVDKTTKIVKGTFQFTSVDDPNDLTAPVNNTVTDGIFNYKYEN